MEKRYFYKFVNESPIIYYTDDTLLYTVDIDNSTVESKSVNIDEIIARFIEFKFIESSKEHLEDVIKTYKLRKIQLEQIRLEERLLKLKKETMSYLYNNISYL